MRFIFLNRYFYPDHSATSQILSDLAFYLAARGESVHVVTSRQCYDWRHARLPAREAVQGVQIQRVGGTRFGRRALAGRAMDYLSFYAIAAWWLLRLARRGDVVIAKTDPPMLSVLVALIAPVRGFRIVNWLQDLYPEIAAELGVRAAKGLAGRMLVSVRNRSLKRATINVAIGEDMAAKLRALGVPADKICVIPNWADDKAITPIDRAANPLRAQWGMSDKFVAAYSGNLGRAHDSLTVLRAAEQLQDRDDIVFLFVGGGHGIAELEAQARKRGLKNLMFQPYQSRTTLARSLAVGDVHWLSLQSGLDGLVLPSKFYGIAAAGRPIIVVGSPDGELAKLVVEWDSGFHIELGQSEDFARTIVSLAGDRQLSRRMGLNARRMLEKRFTKERALERWYGVLRTIQDVTPAQPDHHCIHA
ncbi:MAG: glycosyltransferase family 4 protein [Alphaproteobacteria bacterium]|nr:glycosyltransferase family 4 protein [Alphaproteobacteria bacterium]MDE2111519.1 glycosyltransferase family 4 protein [Alphaproteobacteria bacterium]MDE2493936.1 glycosyltransferase family 4 protein [Alphaproteobacteria bacterium]